MQRWTNGLKTALLLGLMGGLVLGAGALIGGRSAAGRGSEHDPVALPRSAAQALVAAAGGSGRISFRHVGVIVKAEPVVHPFSDITRHVMQSVVALARVTAAYGGQDRNFMYMMLAEHGALVVRSRLAPGE